VVPAGLPLAFREEGNGVLHPGNASGIVDGAAAVLVASERACEEYGREPPAASSTATSSASTR
jgi:acetyl-CoA acetyltransferase